MRRFLIIGYIILFIGICQEIKRTDNDFIETLEYDLDDSNSEKNLTLDKEIEALFNKTLDKFIEEIASEEINETKLFFENLTKNYSMNEIQNLDESIFYELFMDNTFGINKLTQILEEIKLFHSIENFETYSLLIYFESRIFGIKQNLTISPPFSSQEKFYLRKSESILYKYEIINSNSKSFDVQRNFLCLQNQAFNTINYIIQTASKTEGLNYENIPSIYEEIIGINCTSCEKVVNSYYDLATELIEKNQMINDIPDIRIDSLESIKDDEKQISELKEKYQILQYGTDYGNIRGHSILGRLNLFGDRDMGIQRNNEVARQHFQAAVDEGNPMGNYGLGILELLSENETLSLNKSINFFELAAEAGYLPAYEVLAQIYSSENLHQRNIQKALNYYQILAQHEIPIAFYKLGKLYQSGSSDFKPDLNISIKNYERADFYNYLPASYELGKIYLNEKNNLSMNCQKALNYFAKIFQNIDKNNHYHLGIEEFKKKHYYSAFNNFLYSGISGVPKGFSAAAFLMERKNISCRFKDRKICAIELYAFSSDLNDSFSALKLGDIFYDGSESISPNLNLAFSLYNKSANFGNTEALFNIAYMLSKGEGIEKNNTKAIEIYRKLLSNNDSFSYFPALWSFIYVEIEENINFILKWLHIY